MLRLSKPEEQATFNVKHRGKAEMLDLHPFKIGALYHRRDEIHAQFGGQRQGGISTPTYHPFVFIFTGEAGKAHGYGDDWEAEDLLHYYGEGQVGDMEFKGGNRAILRHQEDGKHLLLFQAMGKGKPYRFLGEMRFDSCYLKDGVPDTKGNLRKAIVFRLRPITTEAPVQLGIEDFASTLALGETVTSRAVEVRKGQALFRRRLISVEKECRLTGVRDLRFLRASHIKPWAACETGDERTDGYNGLLLTPTADHLFDRGWVSFSGDGKLLLASDLPTVVAEKIRLDLKPGRDCGPFGKKHQIYLEHHRDKIFQRSYLKTTTATDSLALATANGLRIKSQK